MAADRGDVLRFPGSEGDSQGPQAEDPNAPVDLWLRLPRKALQALKLVAMAYGRAPVDLAQDVVQEYVARELADLKAKQVRQDVYDSLRPANGRGVRS